MRTPNQPVGSLSRIARGCWEMRLDGAITSALIPTASTAHLQPSISLLASITLEPPQPSRCNDLPSRDTRSHRCEIVLVDHRIVRRRLQGALGGVGDFVESRGACAVE